MLHRVSDDGGNKFDARDHRDDLGHDVAELDGLTTAGS